jgi:hypothetical protein
VTARSAFMKLTCPTEAQVSLSPPERSEMARDL